MWTSFKARLSETCQVSRWQGSYQSVSSLSFWQIHWHHSFVWSWEMCVVPVLLWNRPFHAVLNQPLICGRGLLLLCLPRLGRIRTQRQRRTCKSSDSCSLYSGLLGFSVDEPANTISWQMCAWSLALTDYVSSGRLNVFVRLTCCVFSVLDGASLKFVWSS